MADEKTNERRVSSARVQPWVPVEVIEPATVPPTLSRGVTIRIAGTAIELQPGFDPAIAG